MLEGYRTKDQLLIGDINNAMELMDALTEAGVEILDHTQVKALRDGSIDTEVSGEPVTMPYDVLMIAHGLTPDDELVRELESCGREVICVGNVVQDRTAFYAMHEGFTAGYYL